jgi:large subunit ribosomal protein L6
MSRIGKKPIAVPNGVKVLLKGNQVHVEGAKSKLSTPLLVPITVDIKDSVVMFKRPDNSIPSKTRQGTMRSLVLNMIEGVTTGFKKNLIIEGVGFKAAIQGKKLILNLGFSHPIELLIPEGLVVKAASPTELSIEGVQKEAVGHFAAKIRSFYEPEPYKGKGVRYSDEVIRRKAGKTVAK